MVDAKSYVWGTGRRKSSIARVRIAPGEGNMIVNRREWRTYFPTRDSQVEARKPLKATETDKSYDVFVSVIGGGVQSQSEAVRHGLARALAKESEQLESVLREAGFLTRDARMKERKKYGQRGARARFQFSKR
jgi:small subunit ribosomal protein S9